LGAAYLAGLKAGVWNSIDDISNLSQKEQRFEAQMDRSHAKKLHARWSDALSRARGWSEDQL